MSAAKSLDEDKYAVVELYIARKDLASLRVDPVLSNTVLEYAEKEGNVELSSLAMQACWPELITACIKSPSFDRGHALTFLSAWTRLIGGDDSERDARARERKHSTHFAASIGILIEEILVNCFDAYANGESLMDILALIGNAPAMEKLLSHVDAGPFALSDKIVNNASAIAACHGNMKVLKACLDHIVVTNGAIGLNVIITAFQAETPSPLKLILSYPRALCGSVGEKALVAAVDANRADIVKILLEDKRIDSSANYKEALRHALKYDYSNVAKMLLSDPQVDNSI